MSYKPTQLEGQTYYRLFYSRRTARAIRRDAKKASSRMARHLGRAKLEDAPVRMTKGWP